MINTVKNYGISCDKMDKVGMEEDNLVATIKTETRSKNRKEMVKKISMCKLSSSSSMKRCPLIFNLSKFNVISVIIIISSSIHIRVIEANVPHPANPPNEDTLINTFATNGPIDLDNLGQPGDTVEGGASIPSVVATYKPRAHIPEWNSTGNEENFNLGNNFESFGSPPGHSVTGDHNPNGDETVTEVKDLRYAVASFDFHHVATPYIISLWIIIVGLAKIGKFIQPTTNHYEHV